VTLSTLRRLRDLKPAATAGGIVIVGLYLFPVYWMIATSLKSSGQIFDIPPRIIPSPATVESYSSAVVNNPDVTRAMFNSLVISVGAGILTLVLAAPAAYALARLRLRFAAAMVLALLISQLLPSVVVAGPLFVIFSRLGVINSYLALILADTSVALPFAIIILRPMFLSIPTDLEDAARVDGCTRARAFWHVILPLVRPGLITAGTFAFLLTWGEFVFGLSLTTSDEMQPVTAALNRFIGQYGTNWNDLMAVSTTVALPVIALFAAIQRFIVGGLTVGATKG
jgi:multiple sugar transport system permease protein